MESPIFYYAKISARYGCFIMQTKVMVWSHSLLSTCMLYSSAKKLNKSYKCKLTFLTSIVFDMESPIFYYEKISARYGCFMMQKQWYDRIRCFWLARCIQVRKNSTNHANVHSIFKHTLLLTLKVRFFIMQKYRRVTDVFLCKNNGMITSVAFELRIVFKCQKIQQIVQM